MKRIVSLVLIISLILSTFIIFNFVSFADNGVASEPSDFSYDYNYGYNDSHEYGKIGVIYRRVFKGRDSRCVRGISGYKNRMAHI